MLDLDARVGSLEPGKDADFVILSGDPFSFRNAVDFGTTTAPLSRVLDAYYRQEGIVELDNRLVDDLIAATAGVLAATGILDLPPEAES